METDCDTQKTVFASRGHENKFPSQSIDNDSQAVRYYCDGRPEYLGDAEE